MGVIAQLDAVLLPAVHRVLLARETGKVSWTAAIVLAVVVDANAPSVPGNEASESGQAAILNTEQNDRWPTLSRKIIGSWDSHFQLEVYCSGHLLIETSSDANVYLVDPLAE